MITQPYLVIITPHLLLPISQDDRRRTNQIYRLVVDGGSVGEVSSKGFCQSSNASPTALLASAITSFIDRPLVEIGRWITSLASRGC